MMEVIQRYPLRIKKPSDHGSRQTILYLAVLIMVGAVQTMNDCSLGVTAYHEKSYTSKYVKYGSYERKRRKLAKGDRPSRRRLNGGSGGYKILKAFQTVWSETTFVSATGVETSCIKPVSYVAGTSSDGKGKKNKSSSVDDSSNDNLKNESSVSKSSSTTISSTDSTKSSVETKSDTILTTETNSTGTIGDNNSSAINIGNASTDTVTLDDETTSVTLNRTKSTGNRRHLVYLSEKETTTMVHRTLQNSSGDSQWATIVGDILDRNGTETQSAAPDVAPFTAAPVSTPFTATPLDAPFTASPLATPFTVSPVSLAPSTVAAPVFAEVRTETSIAPIPIATLAPAAALADLAALDPAAPLEPKVNSPKGLKADPAAIVGAQVKAPDKKKVKAKSKKKLPYCDEIDGSVNVPDNAGSQDGDILRNDDTAAVGDDAYYDDTVDKDTNTGTSADNGGKGGGTTGSNNGEDHVTGNTSENNGTDGNAVTGPTPSTSTGDENSSSDSPSRSPSIVPQFNSGAPPAQESICEDFFNGSPVPSDTNRDTYIINVGILLEKGTNQTKTIASLLQDLNKEIAPALLGCSSTSRRQLLEAPRQAVLTSSFNQHRPRMSRLEETDKNPVTEFININFRSPIKSKNGAVCADTASRNEACLPLNVTCDVSYYGDRPKDFSDILKRAILFWDWNVIPGWKGFTSIQLKQTSSNNGTDGPSTGNDEGNGGGTSDGSGANGIREVDQNSDKDGVNPGAFVAAGVAALTLLLIALFVHQRRHKERVEEENEMKHIQLTDDEDDERLISHEIPDERPYGKSYVLSDEDEIENENDGITSLPGMRNNVYSGSRDEDEEGTEVMAAHQDPSIQISYHPPIDSPSLDESSYYRYPSRHVISHRITSYDSSKYKTSVNSKNSRSYKIPDDTVDL